MIKHLEHVGLSVSNLERSIAFYRNNLQMEVVRIIEADPALGLDRVGGIPGCLARIAHRQKGRSMFELFEYRKPQGSEFPADRRQCDHGLIHFGFASSDARTDYQRLVATAVPFVSEPVELRPGVWIAFFYRPDSEVYELRQT